MYNIKAAAKLLDMPKVTIRSWETRYGAITPARTESGHRLYSDQNLEDLQWLKIQVQENGLKISEAVKQLHASKNKTVGRKTPQLKNFQSDPYQKQVEELYLAAKEMDVERFNYLLDLHFSLFHYRVVFFSILVPLMQLLGDEWESGNITIAHEHIITNIVQQRFHQFFRIFPISDKLPKVAAFTPSGENHQLGLLLFTLFLRENGFQVIYVGTDTPLDGLAEVISQQNIGIVCMGIVNPNLQKLALHYLDELKAVNPDLYFLIGGQGSEGMESAHNQWILEASYESWEEWLKEHIK